MIKLALLLVGLLATFSQAQTIYEPVQYEFGQGNDKYFYGGRDARVHLMAQRNAEARRITNSVADSKPQVYSDLLPHHGNAAVYGVTPSDARNEAYANVPRYFHMGEQRGHVVRPATRSTTKPGVILIIPKKADGQKQVVLAN